MWPYSAGETLAIVRRIAVEAFGDADASEPRFLAKGSNCAAYVVVVDEQRFVIRVTGDWRERTAFQERWCYRHAEQIGIPGPTVIAVGKVEKLPYIALTFVEGESGTDTRVDRTHLWRTLGSYARLINAVPVGYGPILDEGRMVYGDPLEQWMGWLDQANRIIIDPRMAAIDGFNDTQRSQIQSVLASMRTRNHTFGLSHGDLDPRNTIIGTTGDINLIDWCCSLVSLVPHVDLYNILRETDPSSFESRAYLDGYGMSYADYQAILPQVRAFGLIQQLKAIAWAFEARPDLVPSYVETVQRTAASHLSVMVCEFLNNDTRSKG